MLSPNDLRDLWRDLAGSKVLTVYLDTRVTDPAMRDAWRPALTTAVRAAGAGITDAAEREEFEQAAAALRNPESAPGGVWGAPGWVAFATADGIRFAGDLPVQPAPIAVWRTGPVVAPYVRALKQHIPVYAALVESGSVRLYRYMQGSLEHLRDLTSPQDETSGGAGSVSPRGSSLPAARGAVNTEAASRRRSAAFQKLSAETEAALASLASEEGWIVVGGIQEWAHTLHESLSKRFSGRVRIAPSLAHDATDAQLVREAKDTATELRGAHARALVRDLLDRAGSHARGEVGLPAVQRALQAGAVDLLLVSPEFIRTQERVAEDVVRAAIEQGATVEVPSGEGAEKLDTTASGIAARLRFTIDGSVARAVDASAEVVEGRA